MFIVIEGGDYSGKNVQVDLLAEYLRNQGHKVWTTDEPTDVGKGLEIREVLEHRRKGPDDPYEFQVWYNEDRKRHVQEIKEHLDKGEIVISARYFYSTLAYGLASGVDSEKIWSLVQWSPRPQLAIYLDVGPEEAEKRRILAGKPADKFEKVEFQKRVREAYLGIGANYRLSEMKTVDASGTREEVHAKIVSEVNELLAQLSSG